ncbi:hypothetical protein GKQ77_30315 [Streptomyces sp. BG9H]|uniref:AfsR family transcriptional regulator n=1 Tax=Streptomyces anatolicus TaxID=2675858 RepID=A0ABS6YWI7_9ACTN|nr:hypothetical protein [Streptomyces anatolicus]
MRLLDLACMDMDMDAWRTEEAEERLQGIRDTYRPGLPQTCRVPGSLWFFAVMLGGDAELLRTTLDATVDTCRRLGHAWELATALQLRANILTNHTDWAGEAREDADEALRGFEWIGDAWGMAEALAARGESRERCGEFALAAEDFEAAITHAEQLGAQSQAAVLKARLGSVLTESPDTLERGEAILRGVLANSGRAHTGEAVPAARLFLVGVLGRTGRLGEAREHISRLREEFSVVGYPVFDSFVLGLQAWLDTLGGRYARGVAVARAALEEARAPLSLMVAPQAVTVQLRIAARALAELDGGSRAADAARLLAVAEREHPAGHFPNAIEREIYENAARLARAALGTDAYEAAYAEGGGLTLDEAAALCAA